MISGRFSYGIEFMKKPNHALTPEQEFLLRAIFLPQPEATAAWESWIDRVDLDKLEHSSVALLPRLYRRLSANRIRHPEMSRMKGIYRHTWAKNQILIPVLTAVITELQKECSKTLLLKNEALIARYHGDYGLCNMNRFSINVPFSELSDAAKCMKQSLDWEAAIEPSPSGGAFYLFKHVSHRIGKSTALRCALRGRISPLIPLQVDESAFQTYTEIRKFEDIDVTFLKPAAQLIFLCAERLKRNRQEAAVRSLANIMTVLLAAQTEIEWEWFLDRTEQLHIGPVIHAVMNELSKKLNAPVPQFVLDRLERMEASPAAVARLAFSLNLPSFEAVRLYREVFKISKISDGFLQNTRHFSTFLFRYGRLRSIR